MKRLAIILAVLVMGQGLAIWCFDLNPAGAILLAAPAEVVPGESHTRNNTTNEPNAPSEEKPADANITAPDQVKGDPNDPLVKINLNNIEMKNILPILAAWTGKPIIPSDEAMKVRITIYAPKEIPRSKALSHIYDALRTKGIIAETTEDKIFLKPISQAKVGNVPILSADEPLARIKDKSQLVEKYFKLKNTSPSKLVSVIMPLTGGYGHVTAHESSGILAVIDTVENLFRIQQTIAQFDVPESDMVHEEIFEIKNGDAVEIVQVINLIMNNTSSSRSRYRRSRGPENRPPEGGENRGPEGGPRNRGGGATATSVVINSGNVPIILLPVPKHNWIIARASAEDIKKIKSWVTKLDIPETSPRQQTIIPIVYVNPLEVVRLVKDAIEEMPGSQLEDSIVVEAMRESKQVVVFGSEENRKFVENLIAQIDLPVEDIYISKPFKLQHIDPDEAKENLESLYENQAGQFYSSDYRRGGYRSTSRNVKPEDVVRVTSFPKLSQISVIATEENMKEIERLLKEWDVPMELKKDQYLIITLKNSDPVKMVELLKKLFSEDQDSGNDWLDRLLGRSDESKKKIVGSLYGLLTFEPIEGTKKILIISKVPQAYPVIKKLVEDLDSQEKGEVPRVITLDYADPEELCDQLNAMLNEPGTPATVMRRKQGLSATDFTGDEGSSPGNSSNSSSQATNPNGITLWWTRARRDDTEMPLSNLIGNIRFIPVHRSKAILALAPPEYYDDIEKMVKKLDQPVMQVMIEAIIVEVDHSSMTSLGLQFSSNPNFFNAIGLNAFRGNADFDFMKEISKGLTLSAGTDINVLLDLLKRTVNAKILNQPNLWAKDNEEAIFFKGKKIRVLKSSQGFETGSIKNDYTEEKVGVELKVRPNITPTKNVDITINLGISDLAVEKVNDQPVINRLDAETNLIVGNGETIMLGGILFQNESIIKSKVPLLGELPVVGAAFSHEDTSLRNNELLVFLTPHVVTDKKSEASKKFIISPKEKADTLTKPQNRSKYISNPAERMQEIRKSLSDLLSKEIMDSKK